MLSKNTHLGFSQGVFSCPYRSPRLFFTLFFQLYSYSVPHSYLISFHQQVAGNINGEQSFNYIRGNQVSERCRWQMLGQIYKIKLTFSHSVYWNHLSASMKMPKLFKSMFFGIYILSFILYWQSRKYKRNKSQGLS